jgi:DNA-binding MarR family transcriptional regulator
MKDIARSLGIDAPYATLVVDDLEKLGLVERGPHPTDRRVKVVTTTVRGAQLAKRSEEILGKPPAGLAKLSASELETIAGGLEAAIDGGSRRSQD